MALGITGWVKNRPDGGVEIVAEGPENTIKKLTAWCHHGPPGAQVSRVMESLEEWKGEYTAFDIVY
jgi:acylphosphatase